MEDSKVKFGLLFLYSAIVLVLSSSDYNGTYAFDAFSDVQGNRKHIAMSFVHAHLGYFFYFGSDWQCSGAAPGSTVWLGSGNRMGCPGWNLC